MLTPSVPRPVARGVNTYRGRVVSTPHTPQPRVSVASRSFAAKGRWSGRWRAFAAHESRALRERRGPFVCRKWAPGVAGGVHLRHMKVVRCVSAAGRSFAVNGRLEWPVACICGT